MFLSKSDYMMADECIKALWLKKNRKDLTPEIDEATQRRFDIGNAVQDLAREFFPGGVMVPAENWDVINGSKITAELAKCNDILFEAFAKLDNGAFCRIDVLKKNIDDWDLIEIKSATSVKGEYIQDLAFQKYVFENAGYPVKQCWVLHLNSDYVRQSDLDVNQLFQIEDVTEQVAEVYPNIPALAEQYMKIQTGKKEPEILLHKACKDCPYFHYCGKDVPEYSVFDLLKSKEADVFYAETGKMEIKDVPASTCSTPRQLLERESYLTKQTYVEPNNIHDWLEQLKYPLYYLDFETVQVPIPLFDETYSFQQIPFQFSLHYQQEKGGKCIHINFIHQEPSDPRRDIAENLIFNCGKKGSILAYNASFEKAQIKELARIFPDLADKLLAINERIVDQYTPFQKRYLYNYKQKGSASIKYVLPAFTALSYQDMEIHNGAEAASAYLAFLEGRLNADDTKKMFKNLEIYCGQDTYAMTLLMDVLYQYSEVQENKPRCQTIEDLYVKGLISVRIRNALINKGYKCLEELYSFSYKNLMEIPNMGRKSARELYEIICTESTKKIAEKILIDNGKNVEEDIEKTNEVAEKISINQLNLSNRSRNALEKSDIFNLKQLLGLSSIEIQRIPSIGRLSWIEIIKKRDEWKEKLQEGALFPIQNKIQKIPSYLLDKEITKCCFSHRLEDTLVSNNICTIREVLKYPKSKLLEIKNFGKKTFAELEDSLNNLGIILGEDYEEEKVVLSENNLTLEELAFKIQQEEAKYTDIQHLIYEKRIKAKIPASLRKLANEMNLSSERVRQIEKKIKQKLFQIFQSYKSAFDEIFNQYGIAIAYDLIPEWKDFIIYTPILESLAYRNPLFPFVIDSQECLIYEEDFFKKLNWESFIQGENQNLSFESQKEILIKSLTNIVKSDSSCIKNYTRICNFLEEKLQILWDKRYLYLENRRIPATKTAILDLFLQKYCENTISLEDFIKEFNIWLRNNNLAEVKYAGGKEVIRHKIAQKDNVLWTTGFKLRYYPIEQLNVKKFIDTLDLNQYNNLEFSCKKIYLDYPDLMKEYDIRDEYELHNFLRKQVSLFPKQLKVDFARMPTLRIGAHNKKQQALEIIHEQAPISVKDFVRIYSEKYGLPKGNVVSNIIPLVSKHLSAGIFSDLIEELPPEMLDFLSHSLTEDFYYIEDINQLITNHFSGNISKYLTTHNFKKLHFVYNTEYIYSEKYASINEYFRSFLAKVEILDLNKMKKLKNLRAFLTTLNMEISTLNYIEFSKNKYINITKLEQLNITKKDIHTYIQMVSKFTKDEFFTIHYLREKGFLFPKLDNLGFDEFFFSSILKASDYFNVKSVNNTYVFVTKEIPLKVEDFLEKIVGYYRKIDIYDLEHLLKERYDIDLQKHELISFAKNSDLYYNPIMDKIYINYDEFFETV